MKSYGVSLEWVEICDASNILADCPEPGNQNQKDGERGGLTKQLSCSSSYEQQKVVGAGTGIADVSVW